MRSFVPFPSLVIDESGIHAQGAFAAAQAGFLSPDPREVARVDRLLREQRAGVVAHFYMDPELQAVLYGCRWPHVHVSDSLQMADRAVEMVSGDDPARDIVVLGVDFMAENVRALVDAAGSPQVGVYRVAKEPIGCSLADAAESAAYAAYLERAAATPRSLHVVYINTSLRTKAHAHARVPTITCTSSNVVKTVLAAFAADPEIELWFGPDTYMGHNLVRMLASFVELEEGEIRAIHPAHDRASLRRLLARFHTFEQGNCIVHHLFGADVVATVREHYPHAHLTAHLEVPGEMFELALAGQRAQRGVVGSTADLLRYIRATVARAPPGARETFVLGTEAGMVTSIVRAVRELLAERIAQGRGGVAAEIVFPVASEALWVTGEGDLPLVPGVGGGEGCSTAGGCATCPFMKMNSLDALVDLLELLAGDRAELVAYAPRTHNERILGASVAELGTRPILHMREFQRTGVLPSALLADVRERRR